MAIEDTIVIMDYEYNGDTILSSLCLTSSNFMIFGY